MRARELERIRAEQERTFAYRARVLPFVRWETADDGTFSAVYAEPFEMTAGFAAARGSISEGNRGESLIEVVTAGTLRFPLGFRLAVPDRVELVEAFGEALEPPLCFELASDPRRGLSCFACELKAVKR